MAEREEEELERPVLRGPHGTLSGSPCARARRPSSRSCGCKKCRRPDESWNPKER